MDLSWGSLDVDYRSMSLGGGTGDVGSTRMTTSRPAFYARTGSPLADLVTLFHLPYTMWHLSYVAIGAALATEVDAIAALGDPDRLRLWSRRRSACAR